MLTVIVVLVLAAIAVGIWRYRQSGAKLVERYMTGEAAAAAASAPAPSPSPSAPPSPQPPSPMASRLRALLAAKMPNLAVDKVRVDQLDALALTEFIWDVEKEFKIKIPEGAVGKCRTFQDLVAVVGEQLRRPKPDD